MRVSAPRPTAAPAGLKALDTEWRRFITKTVPDAPLTDLWEAPKGAASAKATIRHAALKKALKKAATKAAKKTPGKTAEAPPKKAIEKATKKRTVAHKAPARNKAAKK